MSKFMQYLKAAAIGLLIPLSAQAQKKAPQKDPVKVKIAELTKRAGKYNLWDERKPVDYDAAKDFLKYPVKINYTVDSLMYAEQANLEAYFQEAVIINYIRSAPDDFTQNLQGTLIHEGLHYIQNSKIKHILNQPDAGKITFEQAFEIAMCKEVASHISDVITDKIAAGQKLDLADIAKIANQETQRYLGKDFSEQYRRQFSSDAKAFFSPEATEKSGHDTYMKLKAAVLSQYVVTDSQMQSICLLPLLTDKSLSLIKTPTSETEKFNAEKTEILSAKKQGYFNRDYDAQKRYLIMRKRYGAHTNKWEDTDRWPQSTRSEKLSMDVSKFFPTLSAEQFSQIKELLNKMAQNEAAGNHADNQATLNQFIGAKDKTAIQTASLMATETRVNR